MSSLELPTAEQPVPSKMDIQAPSMENFRKNRGPVNTVKGWLHLNSFGGRLFWMIMLGALAGMGGMAFWFSEMLKRQAEDQVRSSIDSKVNAIASVTESAETLAYSLGVSATTLNDRGAQFSDTYRELVLQLFEGRPDFVVGLGLGQSEYGIIEDQQWLFPYYSVLSFGEATVFNQDTIRYEDFADDEGAFYPETERYEEYFLPQESAWTEPYQGETNRLLTYYYPLFNKEGRWLGTTLVDVDSAYLAELLDDEVFQQAGNFLLMTRSGVLIANPTDPMDGIKTYEDIAGLAPIWQQVREGQSGFLPGESGYWAYSTVPGQDWLLFGYVPYQAIYGRIIRIAALTTGVMALLLTTVVYLAIRKLNQRIKPILLQGNEFAQEDDLLLTALGQKDELEQLSLSFFNILNQLNLHQETIRQQAETIAQSNLRADQVTEKFLAFTTQIDEEVRTQQALLKKVQQQLADQVSQYKTVDSRLDALFTLAQTLSGFLESIPSEAESAQMFDALDRRILELSSALDQMNPADRAQTQTLLTQLMTDMANLKAYDRQRHSLGKLHTQTTNINQTRQITFAQSQTMATAAQSITQILSEIETITQNLNRDSKQVSDMLWEDLEQPKITILNQPLSSLDNIDDDLMHLDHLIAAETEKTNLEI